MSALTVIRKAGTVPKSAASHSPAAEAVMKTSSPILDAALQAVQQRAVTPTNQPVHPMLANIHPVMQVALAPFVVPKPLSEAECLAIDRAMHADKINDGYGKRNEANAMRLQMADPRGLS